MSTTHPDPSSNTTPSQPTEMASAAKSIPLTLIVATTPSLGIGLNGSLPWSALRAEMAYFARVTKRVVARESASQAQAQAQAQVSGTTTTSTTASPQQTPMLNAVVMGRKTYESIPARFRPLKERVNIVLTRSANPNPPTATVPEGPFFLPSLPSALDFLARRSQARTLGRVFVIGGAEIYSQAARLENCKRVLRTRIEREYECDVSFPVDLEADHAWRRCGHEELESWIGESVPAQMQQDEPDGKSVVWRYEMWERRDEDEHGHDGNTDANRIELMT